MSSDNLELEAQFEGLTRDLEKELRDLTDGPHNENCDPECAVLTARTIAEYLLMNAPNYSDDVRLVKEKTILWLVQELNFALNKMNAG